MRITSVKVRLVENMMKVKAIAAITIDDAFVIHDLRVVEGARGFFVAMPSRQLPNGEFMDVAHPVNSVTRVIVQDAVLAEFERTSGRAAGRSWPAAVISRG